MKEIYSEEDFDLIDRNKSEMKYLKNETIIKQGSYVSQVIFLKKGLVKIILEGKNNRNIILKIVSENNFIALPVIENSDKYPYSVIAINECEVCIIRKESVVEIMKRNIKAGQFLLNWYSKDYLYMYQKITTISTRNNHGKLASSLIYLSSEEFNDDILNKISRKDLAELSSISLESVNKILMELKNDMIIEIDRKKIKLIKRELIEKLSTIG